MADTFRVDLLGGEPGETAVFTPEPTPSMLSTRCTLRCRFRGQRIEATAADFFDALCLLREQLAQHGLKPMCWGANRDVYPSGMARDMAQGMSAYRLKIGRQVRLTDLVNIFESGPAVDPVTVAEQRAFFERWEKSV
jgi:hypothetical protein